MGPSGSGKTTLLDCISCFIPADSGSVLLDGEEIGGLDERRLAKVRNERLGFVFQDFMLFDGRSVFENICVPQIIKGSGAVQLENRARQLSLLFGIDGIAEKYPAQISGGEKQRTAVARALMNEPDIILADEPTGNLDSKSCRAVIDAFLKAKGELHATVFMVTHASFSASSCDRVIVLKDGMIYREVRRKGARRDFFDELLKVQKEMGLFLALGAPRSLLKRELFQEIVYLSLSGCAAGMLLSVPVSMGIWRLFRQFIIDTKEMVYRPGAPGVLWRLVFSVCVTAAIFVMAVGYVNRTNVIEILNTHRIAEPVPQVKGYYAGVGIALMLAGMVLGFAVPQLCIRHLRFVLPPVWNVTYLLCLAGLYLVMVYLVVHARRGRKPDKYYRHIISTSMMRFMGRQTVSNMCVAAMLVFGALFASFYVPVLISGLRENVRLHPVDCSFHSRESEARISEEEIRGLASEHGAAVRDYWETGGVRLIVDGWHQDWLPSGRIEETYREKIGMENFVSESAFRAMSGEEIDVPAGGFLAVVTDNMPALSPKDTMLISDPVTEESRSFKNAGQVIFNDNITNSYGPVFYLLDDADYRYFADSLPEEYRLRKD